MRAGRAVRGAPCSRDAGRRTGALCLCGLVTAPWGGHPKTAAHSAATRQRAGRAGCGAPFGRIGFVVQFGWPHTQRAGQRGAVLGRFAAAHLRAARPERRVCRATATSHRAKWPFGGQALWPGAAMRYTGYIVQGTPRPRAGPPVSTHPAAQATSHKEAPCQNPNAATGLKNTPT